MTTYAISLWAPWAWALMYGGKDVENRSLKFHRGITGRVWVHASQWPCVGPLPKSGKARQLWDEEILHVVDLIDGEYSRRDVPTAKDLRGCVVGSIEVTGYRTPDDPPDSQWYAEGSLGIMVRDPQPLAQPISAKGALGWWKPKDELLAQLQKAA